MKHLKRITLIYIALLSLWACKDEGYIDFSTFPEVLIAEGRNHELAVGQTLYIDLIINSSVPMRSLEVYKNGKLLQTNHLEYGTTVHHPFEFLGLQSDVSVPILLTFVAIDNNGNSGAANATVSVLEVTLDYSFENARISNSNGNGLNAWDLTTNQGFQVGSPQIQSNTVDMVNLSNATGWIKGWNTSSDTRFVKLNSAGSLNLAQLSLGDLIGLYSGAGAGNASSELIVETGDVLIARLRNTSEYALIMIDQVEEASDNKNETIQFSYKKSSAIAGQD